MKSYLSLIPISAKVRRRQNRMTLLCIIFAVFLVTAVFGMAEMGMRMEQGRLEEKHGSLPLLELLSSSMGQTLLPTAVFLFLMILVAGVLMISGSLNSSVAQRTQFFGMMRCIGMSKRQIRHFVRLEALNWCKTAVPIGLLLGVVTTWILCAVLRFLVGEEFSSIPVFGISWLGIGCGILVGVVTVLFAANAPAKRASKVSPMAAVSQNSAGKMLRHSAHTGILKIETALGINHALAGKKKLILLTGSFALSIVLFLSFSVIIDWINVIMPQSAAASDLDISGKDGNPVPFELISELQKMDGVKAVYGRRSALDIPANFSDGAGTVDLISFDDFDLKALKKDGILKKGSRLSKVYGDSSFVLATSDPDSTWKIGDTVSVNGEILTIAGLLKYDPFSGDGMTNGKLTLIASGETFVRLTGEENYSLVMIQTAGDVTDEAVQAIRDAAGADCSLLDKRDERTSGTYLAFVFCVDTFLMIIALVAVLNIINSISMSVSTRMKQYGAMRAVGMDIVQTEKMIAAEAFTYAVLGCGVGCLIGLPLHKLMYSFLIADRYAYAVWEFPAGALFLIVLFMLFATAVAVYGPAKRLRRMSITATINEL